MSRFDEEGFGTLEIIALIAMLMLPIFLVFASVSHIYRFYFPAMQKNTFHMLTFLALYAFVCGMEFLFPQTFIMQSIIKSVCKAVIVNLQFGKALIFFGMKHSIDIQIQRAMTCLRGHPPVSGYSANPIYLFGWMWYGGKIEVNKRLLQIITWREYFYTIGICINSYVVLMLEEYDLYNPDDTPWWKKGVVYLQISQFCLLICGVSGVQMSQKLLGPLIMPGMKVQKAHGRWAHRLWLFIFWMFCMDFLQNNIGILANKNWWKEYGNFVILLEHIPVILLWHFTNLPPKNELAKEIFANLETVDDFARMGVIGYYESPLLLNSGNLVDPQMSLQVTGGGSMDSPSIQPLNSTAIQDKESKRSPENNKTPQNDEAEEFNVDD